MRRCCPCGPRGRVSWRMRNRATPLLPPAPLTKAFWNQPELKPALLLNGHVLMDDVLGRKALGLLCRVGLLTEMSPQELEGIWDGGLEDWWNSLPDERSHRRHLLIRLWAAVAELSSVEAWASLNTRCVRSVTGEWVTVDEGGVSQRGARCRRRAGRTPGAPADAAVHPRFQPLGFRMGHHPSPSKAARAGEHPSFTSLGLDREPCPEHQSSGNRRVHFGRIGFIPGSRLVGTRSVWALGEASKPR